MDSRTGKRKRQYAPKLIPEGGKSGTAVLSNELKRSLAGSTFDDDVETGSASQTSTKGLQNASTADLDEDSNALILDPSRAKRAKKQAAPQPKRLSGRQKKRLQKVLEKKEKRQERQNLLKKVADQAISKDRADLLHRSMTLSSKMTMKQKVRQQLKEERAGINVTESSQSETGLKKNVKHHTVKVTVPRKVNTTELIPESESESDDDDDTDAEDTVEGDGHMSANSGVSCSDSAREKKDGYDAIKVVLKAKQDRANLLPPSAQDLMRRSKQPTSGVDGASATSAMHVVVHRPVEIQTGRLELPILKEEHEIMEAVKGNPIVIICGETGSGKTTQVPQFLYESGFTRTRPSANSTPEEHQRRDHANAPMIGVTEPRRIAATSMAARVGRELALSNKEVSHQIRYSGTTSSKTEIKFMTDGVLAKEIENDFALRKYSAIIIDEAHERSMHTDILLGLLSRIVPLREKMAEEERLSSKTHPIGPLKLIIMSATLRVDDFAKNDKLFPNTTIPVISVDARQFPVTVHFSRKTTVDQDNVAAAFRKVCQIHERLPAGGVLVFLTGQADIWDLVKRLRANYRDTRRKKIGGSRAAPTDAGETTRAPADILPGQNSTVTDPLAEFDGELSDSDDEDTAEAPTRAERRLDADSDNGGAADRFGRLHVLPLYSALATEEQSKVFDAVPAGHRLVVVATNVAETSLTIPGIRYVVDSGQSKSRHYDDVTGITSMTVEWISKASADQRSGRAGRTGPGHCYRLYSSAVYQHDFEEFAEPEIRRMPADGLVLQMKAMNISKVVNFPFPTPPHQQAIVTAEKLLTMLGALEKTTKQITRLGKAMAQYPVAPRYAKMLCLAKHYDCRDYVIAIVAALTVRDIFVQDVERAMRDAEHLADGASADDDSKGPKKGELRPMQQWKIEGISKGGDLGALLAAIGACDYTLSHGGAVQLREFCSSHCISYKAIVEVNKLRKQLARRTNDVLVHPEEAEVVDAATDTAHKLSLYRGVVWFGIHGRLPPTSAQEDSIRQIILSGGGDHVAKLSPQVEKDLAKHGIFGYTCEAVEELVYIHPTSVLYRRKPEYVVFHELMQGKTRLYMKGITIIQPEWLPRLVPLRCTFLKPLENPLPSYDADKDDIRCHVGSEFGLRRWPLPACEMSFPQEMPDRFRYFARFLLEGKIFPKLATYTPLLKNKPEIFNKPWVKERVVAVLQPLVDHGIDTRAKLEKTWATDNRFLLNAVSLWLDSEHHDALVLSWPPL